MGCKQSAPLKEETTVVPVAIEQKAASPVAASPVKVKEASPVREEPVPQAAEEEAPAVATTEAAVPAEVVACSTIVEEETPAAETAKVEDAAVAAPAPAVEKPAKKSSKKKTSAAKKEKKVKTVFPAPVVAANDENAAPVAAKKAVSTEKRVAFAPRANTNIVAAPKQPVAVGAAKKKGNKKHQNVEDAKVKEMTMAFQRMLTHADHLEYHLSNKNTYNKA